MTNSHRVLKFCSRVFKRYEESELGEPSTACLASPAGETYCSRIVVSLVSSVFLSIPAEQDEGQRLGQAIIRAVQAAEDIVGITALLGVVHR